MVVKSELKLIKSLHQKKYRNEHGLFLVEGKKAVLELYASPLKAYKIFVLQDQLPPFASEACAVVTDKELRQMSALKTPNGILGVFHIPVSQPLDFKGWTVALDDVQDPGNMGTIIRLCDWFGIPNLLCSLGTVDCYNPKVLQATMGSIARVNLSYGALEEVLPTAGVPIYGTFMEGEVVYGQPLPPQGILVLGNEGKGISAAVARLCNGKLAIPQFGHKTAESLNVATAAAIFLSEIRRKGQGPTQR
jgi:RNA methyltransferase, TrmH family